MTLIIGCISEDFALMAGDTQLTSGNIKEGLNLKYNNHLKILKLHENLIFGMMGKWSYWTTMDEQDYYFDVYSTMINNIDARKFRTVESKLEYIDKLFDRHKKKTKATCLYIKKQEDEFILNYKTNEDSTEFINCLEFQNFKLLFNEPFYNTKSDFVKCILNDFIKKYKINGTSLEDIIFLINNVLLKIISEGKNLSIGNVLDCNNSVGGFVTIEVLSKNQIIPPFHKHYKQDLQCLLDQTSNPFSNYIDRNKKIRYCDNLAMLCRNANFNFNVELSDFYKNLINKQIGFLLRESIFSTFEINQLIKIIKTNFKLELEVINEDNDDLFEIHLDEFENVSIEYLKSFFDD